MAKKKKTSTKGLAGIPVYGSNAKTGKDIRLNKKVKPKKLKGGYNYLGDVETVTVPKQWLSSPDHVVAELAYITPAEQKILIDANLYGSLDGKPNRAPGGLMSLQGDFKDGGDTYSGGGSEGESEGKAAADSASSSSSSSSSSDDDGGAYDDDDVDAELGEMLGKDTQAQSRYQSSRSFATDTGRPDRVSFGGYDPSSDDEEQTSAITIADYDPETGTGGDFLSEQGRKDLDVLAKEASAYFNSPITKTIQSLEKFSPLAMLARGITGAPSVTRTKAGLAAGRIGDMQMGVQKGGTVQYNADGSISHVEMPDGSKVGERFTSSGDDDNDTKPQASGSGATPVSVTPAITPNMYYQRGVGSQTVDLADPAQRRMFIQNLLSQTQSPIGATYDPRTATYSMQDGGQRRVSGLDIFKRR